MKKKTLNKKEIRSLNEDLASYGFEFDKKAHVEILEDESIKAIKSDEVLFFYLESDIIPTLKAVLSGKVKIKSAIIDMGAVRFIANGADIMRPGIVDIDSDILKGEIIKVVDEKNKKALCIGRALYSGDEINEKTSGKVISNLHYAGDKVWNFMT